ncbi:hypothetical protein AQUCO_02200267v1 [Aquilegia coerulea]|uniref:Uncharacterized protein n=1 Tax=Aquilegia coerulea TaxID=218851 RepID=A0A2G5DE16_AQUCA|nr:hypothetical protein AQUCO_02200267v1 [Aquilegia coerulea]
MCGAYYCHHAGTSVLRNNNGLFCCRSHKDLNATAVVLARLWATRESLRRAKELVLLKVEVLAIHFCSL